MKTLMTRKSTRNLALAASLMLFGGLNVSLPAADGSRVAVRPEVTGQAGYTTPGYYGTDSSYGTQSWPYADYSQPFNYPTNNSTMPTGAGYPNTGYDVLPADNQPYLPQYGQPQYGQPQYGQPQYGQPQYGQPPFGQPRYRDRAANPNGGLPNYGGSNPGIGTGLPTNWCPTGNCPNINLPNPGYGNPVNTLPVSYPSNGYPNGGTPTTPWPSIPDVRYQPVNPTNPKLVDTEEDINAKITARYENPEMLAFLSRMNVNQAANLYVEAARLIDTRHVNPASYEVRTQRALSNLMAAVQNPAFLRAAGANPNPQQVAMLQQELRQVAQSNPPRTANEAIGLMQWAADLANQRVGVKREAVALEFFNGTLDSLDKYSSFTPTKAAYGALERNELQMAALEENIVGVGVELKAHEQGALVLGTVDNGPAARARITAGDILTGIDGRSVQGWPLSQIANAISGPAGSSVTFRVLRNGQEFTASLRREQMYVSSVTGTRMLDATTGYLRLKQFSESSAEDLEKAMWSLHQGGMKALVLDLRGNPGGLLTEAVQVSNLFVPSGRIVATRGRTAADESDERATWDKTWRLPLVVLVDENSASAAEIFAAAIQENGRGVIVGRTTYGKGTVQTHFPLQAVSGTLKLTTAKFYSPSGREMAGVGVRPDVAVNGNTEDFIGNVQGDQDVRTALEVMARGTPASLAASVGQNRPTYDLSRVGN